MGDSTWGGQWQRVLGSPWKSGGVVVLSIYFQHCKFGKSTCMYSYDATMHTCSRPLSIAAHWGVKVGTKINGENTREDVFSCMKT